MQVLQAQTTKTAKHFLGGKTRQEFSTDRNRTKYAYVGNDPYNNTDPDGTECVNNTDGNMTCVNEGYRVTVPTNGFPGTTDDPETSHYFNEKGESHLADGATREWVENNPTPGNPDPATAEGTPNDATPIVGNGGTTGVNISPVTSYVTTNEVTGNQVVVNVTVEGHPLHPGIVVRDTLPNSDGTSTINNMGEGNGALQRDRWYTPDKTINSVWRSQVPPK